MVESYSSRLEQLEDRISGFKYKKRHESKTEEFLDKDSRAVKGICRNSVTPLKD
jgi:hypothetical protein